MHEISYCEGVLEAVLRRAAGRSVVRVGVQAGTLHRLVPDAFEQSFQLVAAGTVAEGATTEILAVPAVVACSACGNRSDTADPVATCPRCGSVDVDLEGGDAFTLAWLEYAEPAPAPDPRREQTSERIVEHTHERT